MNTTAKRIDTRALAIAATIAAAVFMMLMAAGCSMMSKPANDGISDATITSAVEANLAAQPRLAPYTIAVKTDDGVVHLSGNVATGGDRDAAEKVAQGSHGVVSVDNYIQFGPSRAPVVTQ